METMISPLRNVPSFSRPSAAQPAPGSPDGLGPSVPKPEVNLAEAARRLCSTSRVELTPLWSTPLDKSGSFFHPPPPVFSGDSVFAGDNTSYRRIDAGTGEVAWTTRLEQGEEFLQHDPILLPQGIGLGYQYDQGRDQLKGVGLLVLDPPTGAVKQKIAGDFISQYRADAAGNLYYTADQGALRRVTPQGVETELRASEHSMVSLGELRVTADGLPLYQRVDTSAPSARLMVLDGLEEREVSSRSLSSLTLNPRGGAYASLDYGRLVRLSPEGRVEWERSEPFATTTLAATPDDGLVAFNDREGTRGLVSYAADGSERWRQAVDNLRPAPGPTDWTLLPRPNGDVLLTEERNGIVACYGADGQERWRHLAGGSCNLSLTPEEKLYVANTDGFVRLDVGTGQVEVEYSHAKASFKRFQEGQELFSAEVPNPPEFWGPIVETAPDVIAGADSRGRFAGYRLPQSWSETVGEKPEQAAPVQQLGGYVRVGGVLVPVRRSQT